MIINQLITSSLTSNSLIIDCSGTLNTCEIIKSIISDKKKRFELSANRDNFLKKIDILRISDVFSMHSAIDALIKNEYFYDFVYIDSFIEAFIMQDNSNKEKSKMNKLITELSRWSLQKNTFVVSMINS